MRANRLVAAAATMLVLAACSGGTAQRTAPMLPAADAVGQPMSVPLGKYIKHVVIVVQENRSFNNVFAGWPGTDSTLTGKVRGQADLPLKRIPFLRRDLGHLWRNAMDDWDGGAMDGFENNFSHRKPAGTYAYSILRHDVIAPYRAMAREFALSDHMFPSMFGGSFTGHLTLVASTTNEAPAKAVVDVPTGTPWGCDAPLGTRTSTIDPQRAITLTAGGFPCYTQFSTMADTLDEKNVSWRYYAPNILRQSAWSAFDAIRNVRYGPDWAKVESPPWRVLVDAKDGKLPSFAWVTPDARDSDHPSEGSDTGPSWVAAVVNSIGESPYWDSTAIFVVWDDWGGWYDNVAPPQLDFKGLGIRVP
jgi:phospholipase C